MPKTDYLYPSKKQPIFNKDSCIVRAPAGSGKTDLLIKKYLKLLSTAERPSDCVIITFSKRAALEIRQRVEEILLVASSNKKPLMPYKLTLYLLAKNLIRHAYNKNWSLLENFQWLKISTIDAFAYQILQENQEKQEIIKVCENPTFIYRLIINQFMQIVDLDKNLSRSFMRLASNYHFKVELIEQALLSSLAKRGHWLEKIDILSSRTLYKSCLSNIWSILTKQLSDNLDIASEIKEICCQIQTLSTSFNPKNLDLCKQIIEKLFTKDNKIKKRSILGKINYTALIDLKRIAPILKMIKNFPCDCDKQWLALQDIHCILMALIKTMKNFFVEQNTCDFDEILFICCQQEKLKLPPVKHLLIDEFQDVSPLNLKFIEKIITCRKQQEADCSLFLVGDPMQSIYRFRNADLACFLQTSLNGIAGTKLNIINLTTNFRAAPVLVQWCNELFAKLLPKTNDMLFGQTHFLPSYYALENTNPNITRSAFINYYETEQEQLCAIVEEIKLYHREQPSNTIALIVRTRDHIKPILPLLEKHKIFYSDSNLSSFYDDPAHKLLFAFLRLLHDLNEQSYWYYVLTSKVFALSLQEVYNIQQQKCDNFLDKLLKFALAPKQKKILIFIQKIKSLQGQIVETALCMLWKDYGLEIYGASSIDDFLTACLPFWSKDKLFIRDFNSLLDRIKEPRQMHVNNHAKEQGLLHILTIHQAKGLEFDFVIIPQADKGSKNYKNHIPLQHDFYSSEGATFPFFSNQEHYNFWIAVEQAREREELIRLLYVAVTRAKKRLLITCVKPSRIYPNSFLSLL